MTSERLPGKVLADILGKPMLMRVIQRLGGSSLIKITVVATSLQSADDPVEQLCFEQGIPCFRGHPTDLLERYYRAAVAYQLEVIVRITADCPLIDPGVVDLTIQRFLAATPPIDFAANRLPWDRTYPIGLDTEVCTFDALQRAWQGAEKAYQREHVMPYMYENEDRFRVLHVRSEKDFGGLRWAVDTPEDLEFVRKVYEKFGDLNDFSWLDVVAFLDAHPEIAEINANVAHKSVYEVDKRE
jgi:spore coat polysaccharide biosynthesis protein SpsF